MSIRQLEKIKDELRSGKRTDYAEMSAEARQIFSEYKKSLPSQNKTAFPSDIDLYLSRLDSEWENLCMQIERDCRDRLVLMADLEQTRKEKVNYGK